MRYVYVLVGVSLATLGLYAAETKTFTTAQRNFWSFRPLSKPALPTVKNHSWSTNPIDALIAAKLDEKNLQPNPPADKLTLLRRATLDMTGLPPTQDEIQKFLNDKSPNAWETVVDRLLASPQYGERWARHWLDVARYADSNGFKADETRPNIWRYRDYVIKAFNDDKPTTASSRSRSPAMNCIRAIPKPSSPWDSTGNGSMRPTPPTSSSAATRLSTT